MPRRILVIGSGIAGVTAALTCRKVDSAALVTLFSNERFLPYRKPYIAGIISGKTRLEDLTLNPKSFYQSLKLKLKLRTEVLKIDANNKRIVVANAGGLGKAYRYDSLIIATGATPFIPEIAKCNLKGIFTPNRLDDAIRISKMSGKIRGAAILGAGYVGLTIAKALRLRGIPVTLLARSRLLRLILEEDLALQVQVALEKFGIRTVTNAKLEEIGGKNKVDYIIVNGEKIKVGMLIFATGLKPNVKLAEQAGIKTGSTGAIKVDKRMETSIPGIYACGDCAETLECLTNEPIYLPIGSVASAQAEIAGCNAAGVYTESEGFLRAQFEDLDGLKIASIGLTKAMLEERNRKAGDEELDLKKSRSGFLGLAFNGFLKAKVIYDVDSERIYGAQIVGRGNISNHAVTLLTFVKNRVKLNELIDAGMVVKYGKG